MRKRIIINFMKHYRRLEHLFEQMSSIAFRIFSNSIMFMVAMLLTMVWFAVHDWKHIKLCEVLEHIIIAITFLSFFIIQRAFTHFSQALHLKINELVTSNKYAHNHIIKAEEKSGEEMKEMAKEHDRIIAKEAEEANTENEINLINFKNQIDKL